MSVIFTDTQFVEKCVVKRRSVGLYIIVVLHIRVVFRYFAVDIDLIIYDTKSVAGYCHTAFYIVFASVYGSPYYFAKNIFICHYSLSTNLIYAVSVIAYIFENRIGCLRLCKPFQAFFEDKCIIIRIIYLCRYGVACWEVEYDYIAPLYCAQAFQTAVFPLRFFDIALRAPRESVLYKRCR